LAPVLRTTAEWLLSGRGKEEADELLELLPADKLNPLTDAQVIASMALAFQAWWTGLPSRRWFTSTPDSPQIC
jgi:hypothetical protein